MKQTILSIALIIFTYAVSLADLPGVRIEERKTGVFNVYYSNTKVSRVKVSILNDQNKVVFTESFGSTSSFVRPYNFTNLAEGDYAIVIENEEGKSVEKVSYTKGVVKSFIHVNRLSADTSKYLMGISTNGADFITVVILDEAGRTLFTEGRSVEGDFAIVYNLKGLNINPTFLITNGEGVSRTVTF